MRVARAALVLATVAVCSACGGGSNPAAAPTPTPAPTPQAPYVVLQRSAQSLQKNYIMSEYFAIGKTGMLDATIDYTYAQTALYIWLAKGDCSFEMLANDQCTIVASSFTGTKPRKVSATSQPSGNYVLIIGNAGPNDESVSYQVVFSPSATAIDSQPSVRAHVGGVLTAPLPPR